MSDDIAFLLGTLGDVTQIEMILSVSHCPRLPRQVQVEISQHDATLTSFANVKVRLHWRDFAGDFALSWHVK